MTMTSPRGTAKIYAFPLRGRATTASHDDAARLMADMAQAPAVDFGSGWYHDAAIQDAKRSDKR
ncbi:DUF2735 domain-containing protein [Azorhizobium sp. AG788]|uniref:DUF2735 domain-containing protein n=1 Tax=Azorhizobium sp. AG788 TaxID=2183897 RepID=UPI0031395890